AGMSVILSLDKKEDNFEIELVPHLQGRTEDSTLRLLEGHDKIAFLKKVAILSNTISDDQAFMEEWGKYLKTQEIFYLSSLYIKNLYFRALFIKRILPVSLL